jgi:hypothetical protein
MQHIFPNHLLRVGAQHNASDGSVHLVQERVTIRFRSFEPDAAYESLAFGVSPGAQFVELIVVNQEVFRAARTNDSLLAVSTGFTPLEHIAKGPALTFAQVSDNFANVGTEGLTGAYPGSDLSISCLPNR